MVSVSLRYMCFLLFLGSVICTCQFNVCFIFLRYLMLDVYIYIYLLQLFGKLTVIYHYTIFMSLHFFFLQFILSDIAVSPALFRMDCLFPSFHFSPVHVLRFVSTTCLNSDKLCVSCPGFFLLLLLLVAPAPVHHMVVKDRHPGQLLSCHYNFRRNVLNISFLS